MTVALAQRLISANDPISEVGVTFGGHRQEDRLRGHTLRAPAAPFGVQARVGTRIVCVAERRRRAPAGNV